MSEQALGIVKASLEAWKTNDLAAMVKDFDPDAVCARVAPLPEPATYHGPAGLLQLGADWIESFGDFDQRPEQFLEAGDDVIVRVRLSGLSEDDGVSLDGSYWYRYTVRLGKIVAFHVHGDEQQAFAATERG